MKVLVCIDGSPSLTEGVQCAVSALRSDVEFTLLHVLTEHGVYERYRHTFKDDLERIEALFGDVDAERRAARRMFLDPLCTSMREQGLTVHTIVREGHAAQEIADEAREGRYDIVMLGGARSLSPSKLIMGSTVTEVMQNVRTCIMVIRSTQHGTG